MLDEGTRAFEGIRKCIHGELCFLKAAYGSLESVVGSCAKSQRSELEIRLIKTFMSETVLESFEFTATRYYTGGGFVSRLCKFFIESMIKTRERENTW
jgi:hypothetical protein